MARLARWGWVLLVSTRVMAGEGKPAAQTILFVATQAALAVDTWQTLGLKTTRHPGIQAWRYEDGWAQHVIGRTPSDAAIVGYFGTVAALETAIYLWGPPWLSAGASAVTLAIEVPTVRRNFSVGVTLPF